MSFNPKQPPRMFGDWCASQPKEERQDRAKLMEGFYRSAEKRWRRTRTEARQHEAATMWALSELKALRTPTHGDGEAGE